jgi:S1-C subfamily serine protease
MTNDPHPPDLTPSVFISYRRADTEGHAGWLSDNLKKHFGDRVRVFMDFDDIPPGEDFVKVINDAVGSCHVLIALIGRQWLSVTDAKTGRRRLDNEKDHVRLEIASALGRGVRVIPVLVQDAEMPSAEDLPDDLKTLANRNALEISGPRRSYDIQTLINALEKSLPAQVEQRGQGSRKVSLPGWVTSHPLAVGLAATAVVLALGLLIMQMNRSASVTPDPAPTPANVNANTETPNANVVPTPTPIAPNASPTPGGDDADTNDNTNPSPPTDDQGGVADVASLSAVISNFSPAVVSIKVVAGDGSQYTGSGFIVTRAGHILTTDFMARPPRDSGSGTRYSVRLRDGTEREASFHDASEEAGLGILKIAPGNYKTISLVAGDPAANARVVALGSIMGGEVVPLVGTFRNKSDKFFGIAYDVPGGAGGISGGPVLNTRGEAIGVSHSYSPPLRQCVRSDIARSYLRSKGVSP